MRWYAVIPFAVLIVGLAVGCGSSDPDPEVNVAPAPASTSTPPPSPTPFISPFATPPPTPTPAPRVTLPDDEAPHAVPTEWWYYNGHFQTDGGDRFGFHYVFFRVFAEVLDGYVLLSHLSVADHQRDTFSFDQKGGSPVRDRSRGSW